MPFTVRLKNNAGSFIVMEGENILDAALRQNFFIPYSCHEGICASCEGQIIEGHVAYANQENLAIGPEEISEGIALYCSAIPQSDLLIDDAGIQLPQTISLAEYDYQVQSLTALNEQVFQAILKPTELAIEYFAGQYIEVCLPGDDEPKPFSIANAPLGEGEIQLHIRRQEDNPYSSQLIEYLQKQNILKIRGPKGHCLFHPEPAMPAILIAGGTGFAPIKAIIEEAMAHGLQQPMTLYWSGRQIEDLYLHQLALDWDRYVANFRYVPVITGDKIPSGWTGKTGSVYNAVLKDFPTLAHHHLYIGGPPMLTFDALDAFAHAELAHYYMYSDAFDHH